MVVLVGPPSHDNCAQRLCEPVIASSLRSAWSLIPLIEVTVPGSPKAKPHQRCRSFVGSGVAPEPHDWVPPEPLSVSTAYKESLTQARAGLVWYPLLSPAPDVSAAVEVPTHVTKGVEVTMITVADAWLLLTLDQLWYVVWST